MQEQKFRLTPELAARLVGTYYAYQQGLLDENNAVLTKEQYFAILQKIGESRGWKTEPISEVVRQLERLAFAPPDPNATIPGNLGELVSEYEDYLHKQGQAKTQNLRQELDELKKRIVESQKNIIILSTTPVPSQQTVKTEEDLVPEIPLSRFAPTKAPEKTEEEGQEVDRQKPSEKIKFWVAQQRVERLTQAIEKAQLSKDLSLLAAYKIGQSLEEAKEKGRPLNEQDLERIVNEAFENQAILQKAEKESVLENIKPLIQTESPELLFDITQPLPRPSFRSPTTPTKEEPKEEEKQKRQTNNVVLVLYYQTPQWKKVFQEISPLSFFFGSRKDAKEYLEGALLRLQVEDPKFYSENLFLIQTIRNNIDQILPPQERVERAEIVNPEKPLQKGLTGAVLLKITANPQENTITTERLPTEHLNSEAERLRSKSPLSVSGISSQTQKQAKRLSLDLLSNLGIKIRNFYTRSDLGWLRNTIAISFGVGGLALPVSTPVSALLLGSGGILALPNFRSTGNILGNASSLKTVLLYGSRTLPALTGVSFSEILIPIGAILAVVVGITFFMNWFSTSNTQSMLLTQATSGVAIRESAYISLTKSVNPTQHTGSLPVEAKYSIIIGAKDKPLKNILVSDVFSVFSKGSPKAPIAPGVSFPSEIPAGKSQVFEFSLTFGPEYQDSVISNTVTVKADVEGGPKGETTARSAHLTIGNPPTSCFAFEGSWPENYKAALIEKIGILSRSSVYSAGLCKSGAVIARYGGSGRWSGEVNGGNIITFYNNAFSSPANTFYTLAHESGHVFGNRNPQVFTSFRESVNPFGGGEHYIPTYTGPVENLDEDLAETIAVYVIRKAVPFLTNDNVSAMETKWPKHYNFAKTYIFAGFDGF